MSGFRCLSLALLLLPVAIAPIGLATLLLLRIPFSFDTNGMLGSPLFLLISVLTIIGFFLNFGLAFPRAKKNEAVLASVLIWPANFIVSGFSLACLTGNTLAFHLFVLPMLITAAYNYYSFFRK